MNSDMHAVLDHVPDPQKHFSVLDAPFNEATSFPECFVGAPLEQIQGVLKRIFVGILGLLNESPVDSQALVDLSVINLNVVRTFRFSAYRLAFVSGVFIELGRIDSNEAWKRLKRLLLENVVDCRVVGRKGLRLDFNDWRSSKPPDGHLVSSTNCLQGDCSSCT